MPPQKKSKHKTSEMREKEKAFDLSTTSIRIPEYNSLLDKNLRHYFENRKVQQFLVDKGLVDRRGRIVDLDKNKAKLFIVEQEFGLAEKAEERRVREEQVVRERFLHERQLALEEARRLEKLAKIREDAVLRKELIRIQK